MTSWIRNFVLASLSLTFILVSVTGCGNGDSKKELTNTAVELFAKAQEYQKQEKFDDAIQTYRKITRDFPKSRQGANSQFMIGYIFANHVKDFEQAKIELNRFLEDYSQIADSGLVEGAKFEIQNMGKDIDEIPILSGLGSSEDSVAVDSGESEK